MHAAKRRQSHPVQPLSVGQRNPVLPTMFPIAVFPLIALQMAGSGRNNPKHHQGSAFALGIKGFRCAT
jgi:hypothetical protein